MVENLTNEHLANSDHNIVKFSLIAETWTNDCEQTRYNFNRGDYIKFNDFLNDANWDEEFDQLDAESMWSKFQNVVLSGILKFVQLQTLKRINIHAE